MTLCLEGRKTPEVWSVMVVSVVTVTLSDTMGVGLSFLSVPLTPTEWEWMPGVRMSTEQQCTWTVLLGLCLSTQCLLTH